TRDSPSTEKQWRGGRPRRTAVPGRCSLCLRVLSSRRAAALRRMPGLLRACSMAAHGRDLVGQAVARSHDPVRARTRGLRSEDDTVGRVPGTTSGMVVAAPPHVDATTTISLALTHRTCLSARGPARESAAQARATGTRG